MLRIFAVVLLAFVCCDAASFKSCDSRAPVQIDVQSFPDPLRLKKGEVLKFSFKVDVRSPVGRRYKIELNLQKKVWFWVKLPCISNFGSCTYNLDCRKIVSMGYKGACPLVVGVHNFDAIKVTLPEVKVPSFLSNGKYYIKAKLLDADSGKPIGCGEAYVTVA